jgi:hypothetical protein
MVILLFGNMTVQSQGLGMSLLFIFSRPSVHLSFQGKSEGVPGPATCAKARAPHLPNGRVRAATASINIMMLPPSLLTSPPP